MLWQYLAEVDFFQGESDDQKFVASFALQFLVMCAAAWGASQAKVVNTCLEKIWTMI